MVKKYIGFVIAAALALPVMASAATISTPLFSNGDTTIDATGGSTVNGTFTLQVGSGEVCEVIRTQADTQAFTDTSVGTSLGYQFGTHTNVPFNVKVSPNTGTYNATVQCAGIFGGNRSVDGADGVVVGPVSLGTIRVTASGSTATSGGSSTMDVLLAQLAALIAKLSAPPVVVPPAVNAKCTALSAKLIGTMDNTYNQANIQLQGYLLSEGMSIPALAAGASFGYKGSQTNSAIVQFKAINGCS